jgi:putative endonuclease
MFYVYVLKSLRDNLLYTGSTNDLQRRFKEHNSGLIESTKHRRPFNLIYYEACIDEKDARIREKYLKTGMGKRFVYNRLKKYFNNTKKCDLP